MSTQPCYLVLVPSSLERTAALFRAMALAKQSQAKIILALFEYDGTLAKLQKKGFDLDAYLEGRRGALERFASHLRQEGFAAETALHWGKQTVEQILDEVERLSPDLVIKDVQTGTLPRLLLTGCDFHLLRHCPAPLMLVRPEARNLPAHIMAAVDPLDDNFRPHELNASILAAAEKFGMQCAASVDVVHVLEPVPLKAGSAYSMLVEKWRVEHELALRELGDQYGIEERRLYMLHGFTVDVLDDFVRSRHIDLVVMGTVSRTMAARLELGSTAESIFRRLDCDILAVKAPKPPI